MRAFIAIELPEEVKAELAKVQERLPEAKMKLVEKENLHLTIKFFGEVSDDKVNKIKEKLKNLKFEKFEARLDSLGIFSPSFIRVVWVSLEPCEKFDELSRKVYESLGEKAERFSCHVTLARVKHIKDRKEFINKLKEIKVKPISFLVDKLKLKKSILRREGPIYEDIVEFKLN